MLSKGNIFMVDWDGPNTVVVTDVYRDRYTITRLMPEGKPSRSEEDTYHGLTGSDLKQMNIRSDQVRKHKRPN